MELHTADSCEVPDHFWRLLSPAVYLLLDETEEVLYVGQTGCLAKRLAEHCQEGRVPFTRAAYYELDWSRLRDLERALIRYTRPPYNDKETGHVGPGSPEEAAKVRRLLGLDD